MVQEFMLVVGEWCALGGRGGGRVGREGARHCTEVWIRIIGILSR